MGWAEDEGFSWDIGKYLQTEIHTICVWSSNSQKKIKNTDRHSLPSCVEQWNVHANIRTHERIRNIFELRRMRNCIIHVHYYNITPWWEGKMGNYHKTVHTKWPAFTVGMACIYTIFCSNIYVSFSGRSKPTWYTCHGYQSRIQITVSPIAGFEPRWEPRFLYISLFLVGLSRISLG